MIRKAADDAGLTTSKFILAAVRPHIYPQPDEGPNRQELSKETAQLRDEVRRLREDARARDVLIERYESELLRARDGAFLEASGMAAINPDLLRLLQAGPIHEHRLLDALKISSEDGKAVMAISRQLSFLEAMGFVAKGPNGWRWLR